jgi:hypothetical protein
MTFRVDTGHRQQINKCERGTHGTHERGTHGLQIETEDDWATIEQLVQSMCRRTLNAQRGATRGATK